MLRSFLRLVFAAAVAVTMGFTWTVGQSGLHQTNTNLCDLWKSLPLPAYPACEFHYILPIAWGTALCFAVVWVFIELFRVVRGITKRKYRLLSYSLLSAFFIVGAIVSIGFLIAEYRRPAMAAAIPQVIPPVPHKEEKVGLAVLSNEQLTNAVIEYARRIRSFEATARAREDMERNAGKPLFPVDFITNAEARTAYHTKMMEHSEREQAISRRMHGEMELAFRNEYAAQGRELEAELQSRLARQGTLPPYGKQSERMVLSDDGGFFAGPHPIASCADYLERNARALRP